MKSLRADAMAGVITILTVHQPLILAAHAAGLVPWRAYDLAPVAPFGVPALASASVWGAIWAMGLARLVRPAGGPARHLRVAFAGGVLTTAVGAIVAATGRGASLTGLSPASAALSSLVINGLWAYAASAVAVCFAPAGRARA